AAHVTLSVFDVTGRLVDTLVDGWQPDGSRVVDWSASALPSGVYFARLTAGNQVQNIRMVLLR
ncbi:MAG TPA: T9SS type A sorting domain-containing protein, partial [Rhodothermales bacterium]